MKFLCLAYEEERLLNALTEAEWQALRQETLDYVTALRVSGRLLDAQPLRSATTAAIVRVRNGRTTVTDGPFAETKEQIGGFFLVDVADRAEAVRLDEAWPSARFGSVEVRPLEDGLPVAARYESAGAARV